MLFDLNGLITQADRIRWWPIYHDDQECIGKIQLSIGSTITSDETNHIKVSFSISTELRNVFSAKFD